MIWGRNKELVEELRHLNGYLGLIAEVIQEKPDFKSRLREKPRVEVNVEPSKIIFPQSVIDASELLARWLWLQLPDESKKDLMP